MRPEWNTEAQVPVFLHCIRALVTQECRVAQEMVINKMGGGRGPHPDSSGPGVGKHVGGVARDACVHAAAK